jgi:DUF4097 and DUF4098 domain-containing protein YvlB
MSISEEKLLILKMLEEGKITSAEAARLIEALDGSSKQTTGDSSTKQQKQANFQDEIHKMRDRVHEWKTDFKNNYKQKDFDRAMDDFGAKAEKLGKNVANTTFGIVDKLVDFVGSFVETNSFNFFGNFPTIEKTYESIAIEGMDINIEGTNSNISVKKHLDNKIIIKSKIRGPQQTAENAIVYSDTGNIISLKLNKVANISVSHEILLPAVKFNNIRFETSNGKIYAEDSQASTFEAITKNGPIELMGVNSDKISLTTKNSRVQVNYVIGRDIEINTSNGAIDIKHIKANTIKGTTTNGKIFIENVQNLESGQEITLNMKTSNSGIKINMDDTDNKAYKIFAKTSNGGINLLIPDLVYNNLNKQGTLGSLVEAESKNYSDAIDKVNVIAETTNGFIEVVK